MNDIDWELYESKLQYLGYGGDSEIAWMQEYILDDFENNPSFTTISINGTETGVIIVDELTLNKIPNQKRIIMKPNDELCLGDLILWNDSWWICFNVDNDFPVYNYGMIKKCNITLKWINKNDILIEKPAITTSQTLYTTGLKEEKLIQVPDGMTGIIFPLDKDTKELNRGDSFIFNKTKYTISYYNDADRSGVLNVICDERTIDPEKDDMVEMIANRWDKDGNDRIGSTPTNPDEPEPSDNYRIEIDGDNEIFITDSAIYVATVYNDEDPGQKSIMFSISNTTLAKILSQGNNQCTVKANDNFSTGEVILTATMVDNNEIFTDKKIQIIGM